MTIADDREWNHAYPDDPDAEIEVTIRCRNRDLWVTQTRHYEEIPDFSMADFPPSNLMPSRPATLWFRIEAQLGKATIQFHKPLPQVVAEIAKLADEKGAEYQFPVNCHTCGVSQSFRVAYDRAQWANMHAQDTGHTVCYCVESRGKR